MSPNSPTDLDVPIALRRTKRGSNVLSSPVKSRVASDSVLDVKTPSSRRSKRVRFSDPSLFSPVTATTTSLTPAFRRSSLATPKQRRPATPARPAIEGNIQFTPFTQVLDERCQRRIRRNGLSEEMNQYEIEKKSKDLLQKEIDQKDDQLKQLRMELERARAQQQSPEHEVAIPVQTSQERVDEVEAELEALRQSFQGFVDSTEGLDDLNAPVSWNDVPHTTGPSSEGGDTILIHEDNEVDDFPVSHRQPSRSVLDLEAVTVGLELQAAREAKSTLLGSFREQAGNAAFDFQFADTPSKMNMPPQSTKSASFIPETPPNFHQDLRKQLHEAANRAEEAEIALTALDVEVTDLGFGNAEKDDTMTMIGMIAEHFRTARLELERLAPGEIVAGFDNAAVLPEILKKTKLLSEKLQRKENDLQAAKDQHRNLKGNFEKAIVAAEKAHERVKKLEASLDLNVEETLHIRMRSQQLERDVTEKEKDVASLSNALNKYRADVARLEALIDSMQQEYNDAKLTASQSDSKVEELEARVASETNGRRAAELSAVQRLARINELETSLATSKRNATDLEARLTALQSSSQTSFSAVSSFRHVQEISALNSRISSLATALVTANTEVEKLKISKQKLEERVRSEVEQGAKAVETLQEQLIRTVMKNNEARKKYVNGAKVRIANWEMDDEREMSLSSDGIDGQDDAPRTPSSASSVVRFAEWAEVETIEGSDAQIREVYNAVEDSGSESVPGSVEVHRGRDRFRKLPRLVSYDRARRSGAGLGIESSDDIAAVKVKKGKRKYDSGIGMSSDNDFEIFDESRAGGAQVKNGMMTPELSSEGDIDLEQEAAMTY